MITGESGQPDSHLKPTQLMYKTMLKQFREMKAKHPEAVLLFRNEQNHPATYDAFQEDAIQVAHLLGLETKQIDTTTVLLSFPHHSLDMYLPRITRAGHRVAICEQLVDPRPLVKRGGGSSTSKTA